MNLTQAERKLMTPGNCLRCGLLSPSDRNSAGECLECHNKGYHERQAQLAERRATKRAEGKAYWEKRGIRVGQRVKTTVVLWLFGSSSKEVYGIAKVGVVGAYVSSPYQRGYLTPHIWEDAA